MATLQAVQVLDVLHGAGLTLTLTTERALKVVPASLLTPALRELISNAKPVLVEFLRRNAVNDALPSTDNRVPVAAMDDQEIAAFQARVVWILGLGLDADFAEQQAERMLQRDRDLDDRRLCVECADLRCRGVWRCGNAVQAGLSACCSHAELARDFALQFQRCDGFIQADQEPEADRQDCGQDEVPGCDISGWEEVGSGPGW